MDENQMALSPLRAIPMDDVWVHLGLKKAPSSQKGKQSNSPIKALSIDNAIQMVVEASGRKKRFTERPSFNVKNNNKMPAAFKNVPKTTITFKVPNRLSLSKNNKENSRVTISSAKRINKAVSETPTNAGNMDPKRQVRKVLFSAADDTNVPSRHTKRIKPKSSLIPGISSNKQPAKYSERAKIATPKDAQLKLSSGSIDDFELAEAFCKLQSPANGLNKEDFQRMQELIKKQQALSAEMNEVSVEILAIWRRIQNSFVKSGPKTISQRTRSPFIKTASAKRINLLKATLMKTVREDSSFEDADVVVADVAKVEPIDSKMSQSISMYNAMRGNILRTPKASRRSLERGTSISTTVQKQCLLLMDTPKL